MISPHPVFAGLTADGDEPGDIPMDQLIAECTHNVPQLFPARGGLDDYPLDALAVRDSRATDFVAHTAHMKKIFKLLHSKAAVELVVRAGRWGQLEPRVVSEWALADLNLLSRPLQSAANFARLWGPRTTPVGIETVTVA